MRLPIVFDQKLRQSCTMFCPEMLKKKVQKNLVRKIMRNYHMDIELFSTTVYACFNVFYIG